MRWGLQFAMVLTAWWAVAAERPVIGLLTEFPLDVSEAVRRQFRLETERALRPAGVDLVWKNLNLARPDENFDRIVVLRFRRAFAEPKLGLAPRSRPLGLTHVSNGQVLPFVEIDCRRILAALEPGAAQGRALARVAAHEIYHVLTASAEHDGEGLMKPAFDRRDLAGAELAFSGKALRRLKISLSTASADD